MKILVLTDDRIGEVMAGSALRAWELARALAAAGHQVRVSGGPSSTVPGPGPPLEDRPAWRWADAVLSPPWSLPPHTFFSKRILIVDGATPLLAELDSMEQNTLVRRRRRTAGARLPLVAAWADALLVAGENQRKWWSQRLGRKRPDLPIIDLPFGVPENPPSDQRAEIPGVPRHHAVVLWWGGVWPWLDLDTLLAARARLGGAPLSIVIPVAPRPGDSTPTFGPSDLDQICRHHGLAPPQVVGLREWAPYRERHRLLNRSSLLAVLHRPVPEADLSFRTRALDGLWAGVPLLLTEGGEVSELARRHGWGGVIRPGDVAGTAAALELLLSPREQERCRKNLLRAREHWTWQRLAEPLVEILPALPRIPRENLLPALARAALILAGGGL
ncbi:MAG: glycosyltransferase family 4 protein [Thermoanaerobaculales bacterium]|nr:glycosyltransferase family 4 protein [Thermoanaerobaculales bacterium]